MCISWRCEWDESVFSVKVAEATVSLPVTAVCSSCQEDAAQFFGEDSALLHHAQHDMILHGWVYVLAGGQLLESGSSS